MVKRFFFLFLVAFFSCLYVYAENLVEIWNLCLSNNTSLLLIENEIQLLRNLEKVDSNMGAPPKLTFSSNANFQSVLDGNVDSFELFKLEYSGVLNKSLSSSTEFEIGFNGSIYPDFSGRSCDFSGDFFLSVKQSLLPFWVQGETRDPYLQGRSLEILQQSYSKKTSESILIKEITMAYLKARRYIGLIDLTRKIISVCNQIIETITEKNTDIFPELLNTKVEYLDYRWELVKNLDEYLSEFSNLKRHLSIYCGKDIEIDGFEILPSFETIETTEIDFKLMELEASSKLAKLNYIIKNQSFAPMLSVGFGVSCIGLTNTLVEQKAEYRGFVNVILDLSYFVSSSHKEALLAYEKEVSDIAVQRSGLISEKVAYEEFLESMLENAEFRKKEAEAMLSIYGEEKKLVSDMLKSGHISTVDALQYEIKLLQLQYVMQSISDDVWLYQWLLSGLKKNLT